MEIHKAKGGVYMSLISEEEKYELVERIDVFQMMKRMHHAGFHVEVENALHVFAIPYFCAVLLDIAEKYPFFQPEIPYDEGEEVLVTIRWDFSFEKNRELNLLIQKEVNHMEHYYGHLDATMESDEDALTVTNDSLSSLQGLLAVILSCVDRQIPKCEVS